MSIADKIPGFAPKREVVPQDDGTFIVHVTAADFMNAPPAEPRASVHLTADQYKRYQLWRLGHSTIQNLLPDLLPGDREKLMSGSPP